MRHLLLSALLLAGCATEVTTVSPRCDLTLGTPDPQLPLAGDQVTLPARPLTSTWDTAIFVGGQRATVLELSREGCNTCDGCREAAGCSACGDCDACDLQCQTECVESVLFEVPTALSAGSWDLWIYNLHGTGGPLPLSVGGAPDTGGDSGTSDGGTSDGGTSDGGTSDGGTSDGGTSDGGTSDGGTFKR